MYDRHKLDKILFNQYHLGYVIKDSDGFFLNFKDLTKDGNIVFEYKFNNDCLTCSRSNAIAMRDLMLYLGYTGIIETMLVDSNVKFFW